jgi:hypothetical protein
MRCRAVAIGAESRPGRVQLVAVAQDLDAAPLRVGDDLTAARL